VKNKDRSLLIFLSSKTLVNNSLICHAETACTAAQSLHVEVEQLPESGLRLRYELTGDLARLRIPAPQPPAAIDGLWQHTCFEAFIAVEGETQYHEFNFSPSGEWAAYSFSDYRVRKAWAISQAPLISVAQSKERLLLEAVIAAADLPPNRAGKPLQLGLTAVLEADDGSRSYWALHHPAGQPDFHHRTGFILSFDKA
jgi:hypothetical protein